MKISLSIPQRAALTAGVALMGVGALVGGVSFVPQSEGIRTVDFGPRQPCSTCGHARPMTIVTPEGVRWYITEPGSVQEMGEKYCPRDAVCKVIWD